VLFCHDFKMKKYISENPNHNYLQQLVKTLQLLDLRQATVLAMWHLLV